VAATQHITITAAGLITPQRVVTASGKETVGNGYQLNCTFDGTNLPLVISTGVALT